MKQSLIIFLICLLPGLFMPLLRASDQMGYELYYDHVAGSTFRVHIISYYSCSASSTPLPGPAPLIALSIAPSSPNCPAAVPLGATNTVVSYQEVTASCFLGNTRCTNGMSAIYGVVCQHEYRDYVLCTSCPGCAYTFSVANCCRSSTIISGQQSEGIWLPLVIYPDQAINNHSPRFLAPPSFLNLAGTNTQLPNLATDPDGDELRYSLAFARQNDTTVCTYAAGYSAQTPLGTTWLTSLDSLTGDLSMEAVPGITGSVVVCLKVAEYRNGMKLGEITRDYQHTTFPASPSSLHDSTPVVDPIQYQSGVTALWGTDSVQVADGDTLRFSLDVSDPWSGEVINYQVVPHPSLQGSLTWSVSQLTPVSQRISLEFVPSQAFPFWFPADIYIRDAGCIVQHTIHKQVMIYISPPTGLIPVIHAAGCQQPYAGSVQVVPYGLVPPVSYAWTTGDTTATLDSLQAGVYSVTATDAAGTTVTDTFTVPQSDLQVSLTGSWNTCSLNGGSIFASVSGGIPPYTYQWNNGATAPSLAGICKGTYAVTVSDASGCQRNQHRLMERPPLCGTFVYGKIFIDYNQDCVYNSGDVIVPNMVLGYAPGLWTISDPSGDYSFRSVDSVFFLATSGNTGNIGSILEIANNCLPNSTLTVLPNTDTLINIPVNIDTLFADADAGVVTGIVRPGFSNTSTVYTKFTNTSPCIFVIQDYYDPLLSVSTISNPGWTVVHNQASHFVQWTSTLQPISWQQSVPQSYHAFLPPGTPLGTLLRDSVVVSFSGCMDGFSGNDSQVTIRTVTGSYDPNDKQALPTGNGPKGFLPPTDSLLTYTIRFQNTGTDTAFTVILRDTLSPLLDAGTLSPLGSRHPFRTDIENGNVAVFTFENILLPDSATNPIGSQGFITFQIMARGWQHMGELNNRAAIYFDFNPPIITNTVTRTRCVPVTLDFDVFDMGNNQAIALNTSPPNMGTMHWQWLTGAGDTIHFSQPQPFTYADSGAYTITLIGHNECSADTVSKAVRVTAVDEKTFASAVSVIPNPVSAGATVLFPNPGNQPATLVLSDIRGREVWKGQTHASTAQLDRTGLPAGVYVLRISGPGTAVVKVVME